MLEADDPTAELAFHFGGTMTGEQDAPYTLCFDDIHLDDPKFSKPKAVATLPLSNVLVNQVGYLPALPKLATVKNASAAPLKWELLKGSAVVSSGQTKPVGKDSASGDDVHVADFSSFNKPGKGYTLRVGDRRQPARSTSRPTSTRSSSTTRSRYFYHNRSGIEIKMPFAGEKQWTRRPATWQAPNTGDKAVPCAAGLGLRLHARRDRRLVRRRRPRQVRRQRRHLRRGRC